MCDHKCKHVGARCVQCLICFLFDFVHGCFIKTTSYLWGAFQLQCCSFCFLVFCCPASVSFTRPALLRVGTSSISCLGGTAEWWVTGCCTQLIGQGSSGSLFHSCMSNSLSIQNVAKYIYIYIIFFCFHVWFNVPTSTLGTDTLVCFHCHLSAQNWICDRYLRVTPV